MMLSVTDWFVIASIQAVGADMIELPTSATVTMVAQMESYVGGEARNGESDKEKCS
jgi:hypothetical protein